MKKIKEVIVVEGTSDVNHLQNLINADFIVTNGSSISRETLEYIKKVSDKRGVIILTDPDYPGLQIRAKINAEVPCAKNAFVDRKKSIKGHKLGVAECDDAEILRALENVVTFENNIDGYLLTKDLMELGLIGLSNSQKLREKIYEYYHLGYGNAKTLLKRLNAIKVEKRELIKVVKELTK